MGLAACESNDSSSSSSPATDTSALALSSTTWNHDATNDVYYQLGKIYVATPAAADYETLGVYVPGEYFTATANSDGTYTTTISTSGSVGNYTAATAPIVFPVNTPGYSAQKPPTEYSYDDASSYLEAGFVYVLAGVRGKDSNTDSYTGNAPWGVTDLKAAVRYVRYNADVIPGDKGGMFVFGHSGGGAQSAIVGASGDSELYTPYLESLGAAMSTADGEAISDAIAGAMCWCPITSLDYADAAYEWNMGQFASTDTRAPGTWTAAFSSDLADAFATHLNDLGLEDESGQVLTLTRSPSGRYLAGSYYDHVLAAVDTSLNRFLSYTTFPYTPSNSFTAGFSGGSVGGNTPTDPPTDPPSVPGGDSSQTSTTYQSVEEYIAHLNTDSTWVQYDAASGTAKVVSLEGFVKSQKPPTKAVGAFDGVDRSATENVVLGLGAEGLHFAPVSHDVIAAGQEEYADLSGWDSTYGASEYELDFEETDSTGQDVTSRLGMYDPMYFLSDHYDGYGSSTVAPHWRIRTGIQQGDTASTVEINLAAALRNHGRTVDFATVWGEGHTPAEETGEAADGFIAWVQESLA